MNSQASTGQATRVPANAAGNQPESERRCAIDRRQFNYAVHIPERRVHTDRRGARNAVMRELSANGRGPCRFPHSPG